MKSNWIKRGAVMGFLGVALGAFGAHTLRDALSPDMMEIYKTGVLYHLIHSVVILGIGFYGKDKFDRAAFFFFLGIILFSFSLYLYAATAITFFAYITPFGGLSFLAGWGLIFFEEFKRK
jgi:uncharacterized membrane protein YgdD (TMEM256/DUF423 family)